MKQHMHEAFNDGLTRKNTTEPSQETESTELISLLNADARIQYLIESGFEEEARMYKKIATFAQEIQNAGGQAVLVGGSVRDEILGMTSKDYDVEVYRIDPDHLLELLKSFGKVKEVGVSFGVLKLQIDNFDIDISIPRKDSKTRKRHKDFSIDVDPSMSIKEASKRRDFTLNTLTKDILTGETYDYYGGVQHLRERKLCVTDKERFCDDPLRILRGVQFIGRFGLYMDDDTSKLMREMRSDMEHLPKERLSEEWKKLFLRSKKPSLGLNAAMELGIFHNLCPDIIELPVTPQSPKWHPEGDVWIHTLMVVDEAAKIVEQERLEREDALVVLLAAFCHDFGKPSTTEEIDGQVRARGHEPAGVEPTEKFLYEIGIDATIREKVKKLVANHLVPSKLYIQEVQRGEKISDGAIKRLANNLAPATIEQLVHVAKADALGRGPFVDPKFPERSFMPTEYPAGPWMLKRARDINVHVEKPKPIICGRDLIALGFRPGPMFGKIIQHAEEMHTQGSIREEVLSAIDVQIQRYKKEDNTTPSLEEVLAGLQEAA